MDRMGFISQCGIEMFSDEKGYRARVEIGPEHCNPYGIVHGGLLYTMADTVTGYTAMTLMRSPVTLNSDFHCMKNVHSGVLSARAEVVRAGRHILILRARVMADEKLLLAEGTFTYYSDGKDHLAEDQTIIR